MRKYKNRTLPKGILVDRGLVYIRIFKDGKPFRESFGPASSPANINLAIAKLSEYRADIYNDKFDMAVQAKRIKTADAIDLFVANGGKAYKTVLSGFRAFTDGKWYDTVNHAQMLEYRSFRTKGDDKRRVSDSTVNRELTAISAMYYKLRKLVELKEIPAIKMPEISPCKHVPRFDERLSRRSRTLSAEEFQSFMAIATPKVQRAVLGALNTALRKKDLFALKQDNTAEGGLLRGEQNKVGKLYVVPENDNMQALFNSSAGSVFDTVNFRKEFEGSREAWLATFPEAERKARHFLFMDLRRTALRKVYDETKDILLCRDLAGHSDVRTTQLYLGLTASDIKRAGNVLGKAFSYQLGESGGEGNASGSDEATKIGFKAGGI
jgi:integrase